MPEEDQQDRSMQKVSALIKPSSGCTEFYNNA